VHAAARELRLRHLRRRIGGVYQGHDLRRELEQAERLHLVGHAEGHAAIVLLCRHDEDEAAAARRF
jgi:hypothetical protein